MDDMEEHFLLDFEDEKQDIYNPDCEEVLDPNNNAAQPAKKAKKKYKQVRPKVMTEWTHDGIIKLINAVEERRTLWDISSSQYKLPKTSAWQEIADCIGDRTADECKAKWCNLRVTFKTNLSKTKRLKSGSAAGANIVWKYFDAMLFLDVNETAATTESISSMTVLPEETRLSSAESNGPTPQKRARKIPPSPLQSSSDAFREMATKAICKISERSKEKDQFDVFGDHIAAELHSLPITKAIFVKRSLARALVDFMDEVQSDD